MTDLHQSAGISADTSTTVPNESDAYERAHDLICPVKYREAIAADHCWRCKLIARAREDERSRVVVEFMSNHGDREMYAAGYADALRDARIEAAIALMGIRDLS